MMYRMPIRPDLVVAIIALAVTTVGAAMPAAAQYDRDGRYVPSPLGVPADPYARPIPNYSGKPGAARGTPSLPRAYEIAPSPAPKLYRSPEIRKVYPSQLPVPVAIPLTRQECDEGWSSDSRIPRVEFKRRCARMKPR